MERNLVKEQQQSDKVGTVYEMSVKILLEFAIVCVFGSLVLARNMQTVQWHCYCRCVRTREVGVLPQLRYLGMCRPQGCTFWTSSVAILAILVK